MLRRMLPRWRPAVYPLTVSHRVLPPPPPPAGAVLRRISSASRGFGRRSRVSILTRGSSRRLSLPPDISKKTFASCIVLVHFGTGTANPATPPSDTPASHSAASRPSPELAKQSPLHLLPIDSTVSLESNTFIKVVVYPLALGRATFQLDCLAWARPRHYHSATKRPRTNHGFS